MLLKSIIDDLTAVELAEYYSGGYDNPGRIPDERMPMVLRLISRGVRAVHKELDLSKDAVSIVITPGVAQYVLDSKYSIELGSAETRYILDSKENPFKDDVLKITDVMNSRGVHYTINDETSGLNVMVTQNNAIIPVHGEFGEILHVTYDKQPKRLPDTITYAEADQYEVDIPEYASPALYAYIGYLAASATYKEPAERESLLKGFQYEIALLKDTNPVPEDTVTNTQFDGHGFP